MVTLTSASNALKSVYLSAVAETLNTNANPLLANIRQSSKDVYGKEIIKLAPYGINGGIGARSEDGNIPTASGHDHLKFTSTLKNLYGSIEISDKAIRASQSNTGAFINILNDEMESLIKASAFNLGRMLYGDGSGLIATVASVDSNDSNEPVFDSVRNFIEGMVVDIYLSSGTSPISGFSGIKVLYVDRANKKVKFSVTTAGTITATSRVFVAGSKDLEITGIGRIFDTSAANKVLYGVDRTNYKWLYPYIDSNGGNDTEVNDGMIQSAITSLEEVSGSMVDFISCSGDVRRAYQKYLGTYARNVDVLNLKGGAQAISFNGIPVVYDRFVEDKTMYLLNTKDFTLHQLCDWEWLSDNSGNVIRQVPNKAAFNATLVKYAELICDRPNGQAKITNIASTVANPLASISASIGTLASDYAEVNSSSLT